MAKILALVMLLGMACPVCASELLFDQSANEQVRDVRPNELYYLLYAAQAARLDTSLPINKVQKSVDGNQLLPVKIRFSGGLLYLTWRW